MSAGFWNSFRPWRLVLQEWKALAGPDFGLVERFLRRTGKLAETYPCLRKWPCACKHRVVEWNGEYAAVCTCDEEEFCCERIPITEADLPLYALDIRHLAERIRGAISLNGCGVEAC